MGTLNEDLSAIKAVEDTIIANKVAKFAYTDEAYNQNDANGVTEYNVNNAQNIPTADPSVLKVNNTVLSKGYRAQASSITRMLMNHFLGRLSYNVNKVNDGFSNLVSTLIAHRGTANGFATLDENGRIPYSQLPESAMEYKGQWNAETNTPTLADGTGTKGDFYIVSVSGTHNFGSGDIQFFVNDQVIYDGSVWSHLPAGDVKTVNNISPVNGNIPLTGENIPVSSTDPTLLSDPLTTDRYADISVTTDKIADNSVTTEKIADKSVTNAKIKDPISIFKGGTGENTGIKACNSLLKSLEMGAHPPIDTDTFISQYAGGSASDETSPDKDNYYRRPVSALWEYIKNKISSILGLTASQYNGNAKTATNATNATNAKNTYSQTLQLSNKSTTNFYPVIITGSKAKAFKEVMIMSQSEVGTALYNQNRIHFTISNDGWNDTPESLFIKEYACYDTSEITIGCIGYGSMSSSNACVWLRGGIDYIIYTRDCSVLCTGADVIENPNDSTYSKFTVGTNYYGGTNNNVTILFTPQETITDGMYSNRPITAPNFIGLASRAIAVDVHTCSTAFETKEKAVSAKDFTLETGACIRVLFTNGNSVTRPTLNVNNTGAKEIVVLNTGSVKTLTSTYGSPTTGAYLWANNIILELYYNGSYWVAINNPIIAQKTTCTDGTTADKPAYSCRLDGYKEIYGSCFVGDIGVHIAEIEQTFSLPITMGSSAYNASIALRQDNLKYLGDLGSDVGLSYYGNTTSLTINLQKGENNHNEINDAVLTWIIKGY